MSPPYSLAGPLPRFEGIHVELPPDRRQSDAGAISPSATGPPRVPPLSPEDAIKFGALFERSGGSNGVIPGTYTFHLPLPKSKAICRPD